MHARQSFVELNLSNKWKIAIVMEIFFLFRSQALIFLLGVKSAVKINFPLTEKETKEWKSKVWAWKMGALCSWIYYYAQGKISKRNIEHISGASLTWITFLCWSFIKKKKCGAFLDIQYTKFTEVFESKFFLLAEREIWGKFENFFFLCIIHIRRKTFDVFEQIQLEMKFLIVSFWWLCDAHCDIEICLSAT